MDSFSIHCVTCKSKLIVSKPELLGQIFACPQCSSMVQIPSEPPTKATETEEQSTDFEAVGDSEQSDTVEDFAYAGSELENESPAEHESADTAIPSGDSNADESSEPGNDHESEERETVGLTNWNDSSAAERRKKLLVGFSCVSVLIIIGVVCLFTLSDDGLPDDTSNLASQNQQPSVTSPDAPTNPDKEVESETAENPDIVTEEPELPGKESETDPPEDSDAPMPQDVVDPDSPADPPDDPNPLPMEETLPMAPEGLTPESTSEPGTEDAENLDSVIDDVAPFLSNSPFVINNAAPVAKLPTPKVEREAAAPVNLEAGLGFTVPQIDVPNEIPLNQFLEFLGTLGNIPFTFDFESLELAGLSHQAGVKLTTEDQTIDQILNTILTDIGLTHQIEDGHISILATVHADTTIKTVTLKAGETTIPDLPREALSEHINTLLAPSESIISKTEANAEDDEMTNLIITGNERTQARVRQLLHSLQDPSVPQSTHELTAWNHYEKEFTLSFGNGVPLLQVLIHLNRNSGLQFQANWKNIWQAGWTPRSQINVATEDESLQECLERILTDNGLSYIARANGVLEITTAEHAIASNQIGLYDLSKMPVTKRDALIKTLSQLASADEENQQNVDIRLIESLPDGRLALAAPAAIHRLVAGQLK